MELSDIYGPEYHKGGYIAHSKVRTDFPRKESVAGRLFRIINGLWKPESIIELGCSSGVLLEPFYKADVEVFGVDGDPTAFWGGVRADIPVTFFGVHDLRQPYTPYKKFDVCLCVETAEHIEPPLADVLLNSISRCSDRLFFMAATPGQGGVGHYNLLPPEVWKERLEKRGFRKRRGRLPKEIANWPTLLVMERRGDVG